MIAALGLPAAADDAPDRFDREVPASVADLKLDAPISVDGVGLALAPSLVGVEGDQRVIVHLTGDSLVESGISSGSAQARFVRALVARQDRFADRMNRSFDARSLASVQRVANAVFLEVDGSALAAIAADDEVARVAPVGDYEMDLSETVPYIGAGAVQVNGVDGSGIKVAVLDSGIDYYHEDLGGTGAADYDADDPNVIEPGTFPTAKVVGGYDFVGDLWPGTDDDPADELPDPDPLDKPTFGDGHGTHVADIIGGVNGVAPGVDLYAVKVCSSIASSCSGIALIQGMEFAVDPNGDGKLKDRVDIINMSLGSVYGQPFDDDLALVVDAATAAGVLTVASAGNSADKPYITGTPAAAPTALSVAQTYTPSATVQGIEITAPAPAGVGAVFQDWSVPPADVIGPAPVAFGGLGCSLGSDPNSVDPLDAPYPPGTFAGEIVLVDRGACNFSIKIFNIQRAGGLAGIIGLVGPGEPFTGAFGAGGPFTIPGYMIGQAEANLMKTSGTTAIIDPAFTIPAIGNVVGSSSRGPSNFYQMIKPEIGAPGASVSAVAGTGTGTSAFGGTSGAAPMVAGSAALVLSGTGGTKTTAKGKANGNAIGHGLTPAETKARLMNNGETEIGNSAFTGDLAPITRLGGGEVRADRALAAPVAAWDDATAQGALSFGMHEVAYDMSLTKTVRIRNYDNTPRTYTITPTFRFDEDAASGAISVDAPSSVTVKPGLGRDTLFDVTLHIDASELPGNFMNSGSQGANGAALTINEFDGYLVLDDGDHPIHLAWQILPRQAANVVPDSMSFAAGGLIGLDNQGAGTAQNDAYSIVALSPDIPSGAQGTQSPTPDLRAVGVTTFFVPPTFCESEFLWAFAFNTWEEQSHLLPVSHQLTLQADVDGDGTLEVDALLLNRDLGASLPALNQVSDGRQAVWALDFVNGAASIFFLVEHATNTGNTVFYVCGEQIGMSSADILATNVDGQVVTQDFYFGGPGDVSDPFTITPLGEQYFGTVTGDLPFGGITPGGTGVLDVFDFGPFPGNTPELGVMLVTNGDRGPGARGGATDATEALIFTPAFP